MNPNKSQNPIEYEFSESENYTLQKLAGVTKFLGIAMAIFGSIKLVVVLWALDSIGEGGTSAVLGGLVEGVLNIIIGGAFTKASTAFRQVVNTQGNDILNLMGALGELYKVFSIYRVLIIIGIVFAAAGLVGLLLLAPF